MKLYLASFLESENHGPGRKIAIANPKKYPIDGVFKFFIPSDHISDQYKRLQESDQQLAGEFFRSMYKRQLSDFVDEVKKEAKINNTTVIEQLPFQDGDTLLSWERYAFTHYRNIAAEYLEELGFEVVQR